MEQKKYRTSFKGVWKLQSFEIQLSNGKKIYPFGEKVKGLLIYTEKYMSGKLMSFRRPNFTVSDPLKGTLTEIKKAFEEFIGYYGKYEIDESENIVKHYVEGSMFPNWEGETQERFFDLTDNILKLSTTPLSYGAENAVGVLLWKKVE